ncbi:anthranilate synthase component I [Priestia taiwanensis]|uniref:Anthranilate synthase component 1 n=1 Tax=Priestia taiwanensis TaxID=1347902 RepID=A0A917AZB6_9BACI|nr:anthranilate synthase component I [Priestia taiwanensis]MBM7365158.1 para-aminobenzoate synthetase component 1 [Priestia taiwanensis]GGE84807.1 aminodeoxychorismate synthase, component I [Priestia taiwanensis]
MRHCLATYIPYEKEFFDQYKRLSKDKAHHVLLESGRNARYSMVGLDPIAIITGKEDTFTVVEGGETSVMKGNPLEEMKQYMQKFKVANPVKEIPFSGGAVGYFNYDCIRYIEKLPTVAEDDLQTPDIFFLLFDDIVVYDHEEKKLWIMTHYEEDKERAEVHLEELQMLWTSEILDVVYEYEVPSGVVEGKRVSFTEEGFIDAVERTKEYIAAGDVFQINLSVRQSEALETHPMNIYEALRGINPSPYMAYMECGDFQIVSGSPELLIKKKGTEVSTRPIAGTRSRGKDEAEDMELANELIHNEKERAEHVMLVDLERNDLGRVCEYGTVEVDEFMVIEKYSHVMHIVSNVRGTLKEENDAFDVVGAVFPGGTITGAPKIRTMEIIEELEPVRRGLYTGSIGWIGYDGDMELNIVIRTMVAKDGYGHIQAGAGIVIDSIPKNEYKESLKKAAAMWRAKEVAERCEQ